MFGVIVQKIKQNLNYHQSIIKQFKVEWCKKKIYLPFDFLICNHNIIIELDGAQHFSQVSNWTSPIEQQKNDRYKMTCANSNNFSVIRILQDDVWNDKFNWIVELNISINKIINEKKIQNIFICKNNEYDIYKKSIV